MKGGRIVNIIFSLAFVTVGVFASVYLYRDYQHLHHLDSEKTVLEARLDTLKSESELQEVKLDRLENDAEYIEKVIRLKLNYAKEGESVFRFE